MRISQSCVDLREVDEHAQIGFIIRFNLAALFHRTLESRRHVAQVGKRYLLPNKQTNKQTSTGTA